MQATLLMLKQSTSSRERAETILGETPLRTDEIPIIDFIKLSEIEKEEIWAKKIIGKSDVEIAKLIQRLNINDWVNEGQKHLQEDEDLSFLSARYNYTKFQNPIRGLF